MGASPRHPPMPVLRHHLRMVTEQGRRVAVLVLAEHAPNFALYFAVHCYWHLLVVQDDSTQEKI